MKLYFMLFGITIQFVVSQKPSPCPETFSYEPRGSENDRWYGVISLKTTEELTGVWLRLILDRPAELIGNWFGETSSTDNIEYVIRNPKYKLEVGPPVSVRFFVKYNPAQRIPSLEGIRLNAKTICSALKDEAELKPVEPILHISQLRPTGSINNNNQNYMPSGSNSEKPSESSNGRNKPSNSDRNRGGSSNNNNNNSDRRQSSNSNRQSTTTKRPSSSERPNYNRETVTAEILRPNIGVLYGNSEIDESDSQFFPGDFGIPLAPSQNRPTSSSGQIGSKLSSCGTVATSPAALISYGQETWPGQWPWHAALYLSRGIQLRYICGGTLISERHIVTAAHCVTTPQTNRIVNPTNLLIYLGKHKLISFGTEVQDRGVLDIFIHPEYNHTVYYNDIAVLKLTKPVTITNYVRPCCLWEGDTNLDNVLHQEGTVVGWGFDENRELSDKLMQAKMPIVSTVDCIFSNRDFFSRFTSEKNFCAGFRNGTSVCNGDSGGGMVFPKRGTNGQNPVWQLRGLVSVGVALQGQGVCDPSHYIIFTDVAKYTHWIQQVIAN
ncbi:limulus clotting factor C-like isoform X1 [Anoplophora glabripennis]|uniref:limulus clotting factor C-like isoform X1 n=1 Tax=Anoplophora glabripennis TaxID=217634 RepID=UPI000A136C4F|nr:limulus clotting factor C-like isoform X1 [Anoplophora glabripennis]